MDRVTIISGCPGSGKTTLARTLAGRHLRGVHLATDRFYEFMAHRLDPSTPESRSQNTAVVRSFLAAAKSFREDDYQVFVDGVIGPWWLDTIIGFFPDFDYVILHAGLECVLARAGDRAQHAQASANSELVAEMHRQFAAVSGFSRQRIDTDGHSPDWVLAEFDRKSEAGDFAVPRMLQ